jgi:hypothetical protein
MIVAGKEVKDLEESEAYFKVPSWHLLGKTEEPQTISVMVSSNPANVQTGYFLNSQLQC